LYRKSKKGKILTTQVVRRTGFKREERQHQGERIKIIRGAWWNIIGRGRYIHEYTTKIIIK
jgi:hypothetical protein